MDLIRSAMIKLIGKKEPENETVNELLNDIREVHAQMERANLRFSAETDTDLIESHIFEMESLGARYRYLLKSARESGVKADPFRPVKEGKSVG